MEYAVHETVYTSDTASNVEVMLCFSIIVWIWNTHRKEWTSITVKANKWIQILFPFLLESRFLSVSSVTRPGLEPRVFCILIRHPVWFHLFGETVFLPVGVTIAVTHRAKSDCQFCVFANKIQRHYWSDKIMRPKQVIYWSNFVNTKKKRKSPTFWITLTIWKWCDIRSLPLWKEKIPVPNSKRQNHDFITATKDCQVAFHVSLSSVLVSLFVVLTFHLKACRTFSRTPNPSKTCICIHLNPNDCLDAETFGEMLQRAQTCLL
jgi:hypothetical protein